MRKFVKFFTYNINKKIGPIRTYLDDGYYGSKGGATQKSILESANKTIKTLLSNADKPTKYGNIRLFVVSTFFLPVN